MREDAGRDEIVIKKLSCFGGSKTAVVTVPQRIAEGVIHNGKIRVGLVICRVRAAAKRVDRCFRCHDFGHRSYSCNGPDRSNACMSCGEPDHRARNCKAPPSCFLCEKLNKGTGYYPGSRYCGTITLAKDKEKRKKKKLIVNFDKIVG